ncbi:MAG: hypothetical protein WA947_19225, partial [Phormidesmis sp.]
ELLYSCGGVERASDDLRSLCGGAFRSVLVELTGCDREGVGCAFPITPARFLECLFFCFYQYFFIALP